MSNIYFGAFKADGSLDFIGSCPLDHLSSQVFTDRTVAQIASYQTTYYLDNNVAKEQAPMNLSVGSTVIADGVDEETILGIPNPCEVTWPDGEVTTVTDGEIRFSVDLVGTYTFKLESIPHLTEEVTIEAIPTA